jgi:hypothetical protein
MVPILFNEFVCKLGSLWREWASFHPHFKQTHSCHKEPNLRTNSLNNILFWYCAYKYIGTYTLV